MSEECAACAARLKGICGTLDDDALAQLSRIGRRRRLGAGETLIWEGEDAPIVANLLSGILKLSASTADGREQIVGIAYPTDFIGRPFGARAGYSAAALGEAELCLFGRRDFERFARVHPELEHDLLVRALGDLDRARGFMLLLGRKSASERVATLLLDMADRLPTAANMVDLPIGRQQMADVLGLTIETVSRQLTRLKSAGVIALPSRRRLVINDLRDLQAAAEAA